MPDMTTDTSKTKSLPAGEQVVRGGKTGQLKAPSATKNTKATAKRDPRTSGYTRVKSGELKRRSVSRAPDMSRPASRAMSPSVAIGSLPSRRVKERAVPVAAVHIEPKVRTITDTRKVSFPYSIIFMAIACSVLFMYMIFNYVQINEYTDTVSDLKSEIATLDAKKIEIQTKLDKKNDLIYIEKVAREELGMVKIDEITKKYIEMDAGDKITVFDNTDSAQLK